ncbi:MAG: response regulator transcription factor [Akkermansiaceae bacterium]|jgi:DNA-binding NarL/FixJ family response regulator|nr:response regulator transcription factor [Akkermansiaceae bacterium]
MNAEKKQRKSGVNTIRIGMLEDDPGIREILGSWLERVEDMQLRWQDDDGRTALRSLGETPVDVMLVDINLPVMNGIEFVRQAKVVAPDTQFIMLTVYDDADHIFTALTAGATGYLLKRTPRKELLAAIREVHAGASPMSGHIARKVVERFREVTAPAAPSALATLSPRESEILGLLAQGLLYKEIATQLGISVFTVNNLIRRIYEKMHVNSRAQAVAKLTHLAPTP